MPEYTHVQTYVKCDARQFSFIISKYIQMLTIIGLDSKFLRDNFEGLEWNLCENGFIYAGCNVDTYEMDFKDVVLKIRPFILGWTPQVFSKLSESWLEIDLLFETEQLVDDYSTGRLKKEVEKVIWDIMNIFSVHFTETGVYLTDEVTDNNPWEALIGEKVGIWTFDAAIVPLKIIKFYKKNLFDFECKVYGDKLFVARKTIWSKVPWK